jgi:hypothetical protein
MELPPIVWLSILKQDAACLRCYYEAREMAIYAEITRMTGSRCCFESNSA